MLLCCINCLFTGYGYISKHSKMALYLLTAIFIVCYEQFLKSLYAAYES